MTKVAEIPSDFLIKYWYLWTQKGLFSLSYMFACAICVYLLLLFIHTLLG